MRAGCYRTAVRLEQPVPTTAPDGSVTLVYLDAGAGFVEIRAKSLREQVDDGRLDGIVTHEIRLRHRDDVIGGWRIRAGLRTFRLLSVTDPDFRTRELICLAEEEGR